MCCFMHSAQVPETTKVFAGACNHPTHGLIHVVGYKNKINNRHRGPNCMILAIPSRGPMTEDNFLEPKETKNALYNMSQAVFPPPPISRSFEDMHSIVIGAAAPRVLHIIRGEYEILLAEDARAIPSKLANVAPNKRPEINQEMLDWWYENATGMHVALVCFDGNVDPDDFFYWYTPMEGHEKKLRLPAFDSHDGKPPVIGEPVYVDHELFVSWPDIDGAEVEYFSSTKSSPVMDFLPKSVAGIKVSGHWRNGDFGIDIGTKIVNNEVSLDAIRRLSLPGSKIRLD